MIRTGVVVGAALCTIAAPASARYVSPSLRALVGAIGGDPAHAGSSRYAYLGKLDSNIQDLASGRSAASAGGLSSAGVKVTPAGKVLVDIYVTGDVPAAAHRLRGLGMDVNAISTRAPERMVEGYMPIGEATNIAALQDTKAVLAILGGSVLDTGSVLSQGDAAHHGPQARVLGPTGSGVTVGVISDSMNQVSPGIAGSQSTGDLPANVTDLGDRIGGADEGRAMAEIIYDEAPGITDMFFDTGSTGAAAKAASIAALVSHGAKVIADDVAQLGEPFFQDGIVSQAADQAVANGTAYFASAGNRARQSWEGTFVDGAGDLNDFGGGDTRQAVADLPGGGGAMTIFLQWNEPWGAASDGFAVNVYGNNSFAFTVPPSSGGIPATTVGIVNNSGSPIEIEIEIHRVTGTGTPKLKYIVFNNFGTFTVLQHDTSSPAINPDAASAKGSMAVAAECWSTVQGNCPDGPAGLQAPESFSSQGPVTRLRDASGNPLATPDVRAKPNIAGADGVATSVSGFGSFFGTSAATPSVAGVAALVLSARPSLTVQQLYTILSDPRNTVACTVADPADACGAGFVLADRAVTEALDRTPPSITAHPSRAPNGQRGWYVSPVTVSWSVSDLQSTVLSHSGCATATFTSDVKAVLTCTATSYGGTLTARFGVKLDRSPPSTPKITGISAKTYSPKRLPALRRIHCKASDHTSGIFSCKITGYSRKAGKHRLTATATNGAGLRSRRTLTYRVKRHS
jgi:subtilisin family serine protease